MKLSDLRQILPEAKLVNYTNRDVNMITDDSRDVERGALFVAICGVRDDGHRYVGDAVARGAAGIVAEEECSAAGGLPQFIVPDTRLAAAELAAAFYGNPSHKLDVSAVTGTDGKSSITLMGAAIARQAGKRVGVIGTIVYQIGERQLPARETTPGAIRLQALLAQMVEDRVGIAFMEASSHGLDQRRLHAIRLASAVHSIVSRDHIDYHGSLTAYHRAKARLFEDLEPDAYAVLNVDDPIHQLFHTLTSAQVVSYGIKSPADYRATIHNLSLDGARFTFDTPRGSVEIATRLVGEHNVQNCLAAATNANVLGIDLDTIRAGLESMRPVAGRLERVSKPGQPVVLIDYAHTHHALTSVLAALEPVATGRIIAVFGCGGDRDKGKRPKMGRAVSQGADVLWVTSDNPRSEEPEAIIDQIMKGVVDKARCHIEPDRRCAIEGAIAEAGPEDIVLLAGKGHEIQQVFKDHVVPFSDAEAARDALARCHKRTLCPCGG